MSGSVGPPDATQQKTENRSMRKSTFALGLGLALSLGAADLAAQQAPVRPDSAKPGARARGHGEHGGARGERGPRARGEARGPRGDGALLRGITLTDAQKAQLKTLREQQRESFKANAEGRKKAMEDVRAARERGDTAAVRKFRDQQRTQMTQQMERQTAAVRGILTPEQRSQFDKNVAEMKQRMEKRATQVREGRGAREGRGFRRGAQGGGANQGA